MEIDDVEFEKLVAEALDALPEEFQRHLQNVDVAIAPAPTMEQLRSVGVRGPHTLFGLYEGVPLTERGTYTPATPDMITIFREPLIRDCASPAALREQVRRTVLHEIAHFFGISDDRLHELGAY
ncbi:MAG TPA: metallopeptidase family protein [Armatimonadota bacterium]|nr:metallopeptidase family protein [Armatimonadota bacterium]